MTNEQFEKYKKIDEELKDIKTFCWWCGKKYKEKRVSKPPFNLITKGKELFLHKIYYNV